LRGLNKEFWHQTVTTKQVESYVTLHAGIDLSKIFDQYLRTTNVPLLKYKTEGNSVSFNWDKVVPGFAMPVRVIVDGKETVLTPTEAVQTKTFEEPVKTFEIDRNYYVQSQQAK